jgi:hypothetical protein
MHENEISNKQFEIEQEIEFKEKGSMRLMREAILGNEAALAALIGMDNSFKQLRINRNNIGKK